MNETELWKHLKDHGLYKSLSWKIHKKTLPYQCSSKRCNLCLLEKVSIICDVQDILLNKRTGLISKRRVRNKLLLTNVKKLLSLYGF